MYDTIRRGYLGSRWDAVQDRERTIRITGSGALSYSTSPRNLHAMYCLRVRQWRQRVSIVWLEGYLMATGNGFVSANLPYLLYA